MPFNGFFLIIYTSIILQREGNREMFDAEKITQRITTLSLDLSGVDVENITKVGVHI